LSSRLLSRYLNIKIRKNIILFAVLYWCETWSLTVREERRLRVLRRMLGTKREEVAGNWRRLRNEELYNLYASPNIISVIKSRKM
jgi:hypothetical protein